MEDPPRPNVADEPTVREILCANVNLIQEAKNKQGVHELTLRIWLKPGESLNIKVIAFDFPRYALAESRALEHHASEVLGSDSWDLKLQVLRSGSWEWYVSDAAVPFSYPHNTTELLIRACGLPVESCIGMQAATDSLKRGSKGRISVGDIFFKAPESSKLWRTNSQSTSTNPPAQNSRIDSDPEVRIVRSQKRKKETKDVQLIS